MPAESSPERRPQTYWFALWLVCGAVLVVLNWTLATVYFQYYWHELSFYHGPPPWTVKATLEETIVYLTAAAPIHSFVGVCAFINRRGLSVVGWAMLITLLSLVAYLQGFGNL